MTHIWASKLTVTGSDNGLSPGRHQAIIWTNAWILLIGSLTTNFSEILIEIHTFLFKKKHFEMSSGKWRPSCVGLNVLADWPVYKPVEFTCPCTWYLPLVLKSSYIHANRQAETKWKQYQRLPSGGWYKGECWLLSGLHMLIPPGKCYTFMLEVCSVRTRVPTDSRINCINMINTSHYLCLNSWKRLMLLSYLLPELHILSILYCRLNMQHFTESSVKYNYDLQVHVL